ncbi:MAG: aminotransferase class V-fold PLP-dependent enzyme, partial [Candidatus Lokiarchaeota archaeon]|nr:aminotransferase class V-fold PLP-dependent enzyme [Candidatus Lokiarchaeota archaeon]
RIYGGGHERGIRSGTLNVPAIVGFGEAVRIARQEMDEAAVRYRGWTRHMYESLREKIEGIKLNGHPTQRLPHNLSVSIPGIDAKALVMNLEGVAISTGSACTAASVEPSHVILALGFGEERAHATLRIGVGRSNDDSMIDSVISRIAVSVKRLRSLMPDYPG